MKYSKLFAITKVCGRRWRAAWLVSLSDGGWERADDVPQHLLESFQVVRDSPELAVHDGALHTVTSAWKSGVKTPANSNHYSYQSSCRTWQPWLLPPFLLPHRTARPPWSSLRHWKRTGYGTMLYGVKPAVNKIPITCPRIKNGFFSWISKENGTFLFIIFLKLF